MVDRGGSSMRHYFQIPEFTSTMEERYLLVYWEQRGSGISSGKLKGNDFTLEKMSYDLDKLLHVIAHKYGRHKKLFLLGQSFGSLLSGKFVASEKTNDHNLAGWITIGAMYSFQDYSQFLHRYITQFLETQDHPGWDKLKAKANQLEYKESTLQTITDWNALGDEMQLKARELGQANPRMVSKLPGLVTTSFFNIIAKFANEINSNEKIGREIFDISLREELEEANVPALWLCGELDFVTPRNYGDSLLAFYGHPDKKHVVFPRGTHNTIATNLSETIAEMTDFMESH